MSAASDKASSNTPSPLASPTTATGSRASGAPFKPRGKALAAALSLTRNGSQPEIAPREVNLAHDPCVNGQPLEVFLYKDGTECPLCLMYYPHYMNRTRCCDQLICSECFVQIKRPDPHYPEHHGDENAGSGQPVEQENTNAELIMEPAKCPYCTQVEFGITYDPPPFRRGLVYATGPPGLASQSAAMSSSSSLNSATLSPIPTSPSAQGQASRKRAQSLSANSPGVVTTDRIRPEWTNKLAHARQQQRRRAAAADALHHAAFFQGGEQQRTIFGRTGRFSRRSTREGMTGSASNSQQQSDGGGDTPGGPEPGPRTSSGRLNFGRAERVDPSHLENIMMAEAIRLSLVEAEEQRKKDEKEAKKEAKKREKEDRKAAKKNPYQGSGGSSQNASAMSVALSNLRTDPNTAVATSVAVKSESSLASPSGTSPTGYEGKGKSVDRSEETEASSSAAATAQPPPPRGGSHLRQMSNASTVSSTDLDSMPANFRPGHGEEPNSSNLSLEGRSDDDEGNQSAEPLFNFRSLAEIVGVPIDGEARSAGSGGQSLKQRDGDGDGASGEHIENVADSPMDSSAEKVAEKAASHATAGEATRENSAAAPENKESAQAEAAEGSDNSQGVSSQPSKPADLKVDNSKQASPVISTAEAPSQVSP